MVTLVIFAQAIWSHSQVQELDATLRGFAGKGVDAIILDLRDTPESSDYAMAAEFASRFVGKGSRCFLWSGQRRLRRANFPRNKIRFTPG